MKSKILYLIIVVILILMPDVYCSNEEALNEQKENFEINTFITNAKQYVEDDIFASDDLNKIFENAIKGQVDNKTFLTRITAVLGKEFKSTLGAISSILAIIIIHSILKAISESLENENIAKLIYYVQYILIVTIIMSNFSDIVALVKDATANMVGFINLLLPLLTSLMLFTGSITTTSMLEPTILFTVNLIGNLIQNLMIPTVLLIASLSIISKISDRVQIDKMTKFMKSGVVWTLGIILTIFVSVISLEGTLSSSVDGITSKTTKAVVSSAIPIVGKILGDAVDSILGCGVILKNAVGIIGVIVIISICIMPIIKLTILFVSYKILTRSL